MKYLKSLSIAATLAASIAIPATADTELTMYYPCLLYTSDAADE